MKSLSLTSKIIIVITILGVMGLIVIRLNTEYSRYKNAELRICLSQIELGDSQAEVIKKMKPYRKEPDRVLENRSVYFWQERQEGFTLLIYDPLLGDSGGLIFYFPPGQDTLYYISEE